MLIMQIKGLNSFLFLFLQDALMEVEDQLAAQAPINVEKGREIVTLTWIVLAI